MTNGAYLKNSKHNTQFQKKVLLEILNDIPFSHITHIRGPVTNDYAV